MSSSPVAVSETSSEARDRAIDELVQWYRDERLASERVAAFLVVYGFAGLHAKRQWLFRRCFFYPLHCAVKLNDVPTIELLLRVGADPSQVDSAGQTPSQFAARLDSRGSHRGALAALTRAASRSAGKVQRSAADDRRQKHLPLLEGGSLPGHWDRFFRELSTDALVSKRAMRKMATCSKFHPAAAQDCGLDH